MHTFDDWELRQVLEDTLEEAKERFLFARTFHRLETRLHPDRAWRQATREAIDMAMDARWYDATRPAAAD